MNIPMKTWTKKLGLPFSAALLMLCSSMAFSVESQSQPPASTEKKTTTAMAKQVDAVALVTIAHVSSLVNRGMSFPGLLSVEAFSYQLEIDHLWKGEIPVDAELKISLKNCSRPLLKGESYLVFGDLTTIEPASRTSLEEPAPLDPTASRSTLEWVAKTCEQVIPELQAKQSIAKLNQLYPARVAQHSPR